MDTATRLTTYYYYETNIVFLLPQPLRNVPSAAPSPSRSPAATNTAS